MTENDWNEIDRSSRILIKQWLKSIGMTDIEDSHGNCCYDLIFTSTKNKRIAVEIKDRTFRHDRYGDIFAEDIKQECNQRRMNNGEFDYAIAINVFTDNIFAISNMYDKDARHQKKYCNETTLIKGASHEKVLKDTLSLPQRIKIQFKYTENGIEFKRVHM